MVGKLLGKKMEFSVKIRDNYVIYESNSIKGSYLNTCI